MSDRRAIRLGGDLDLGFCNCALFRAVVEGHIGVDFACEMGGRAELPKHG
jgi:hypothetical protein